MLLSAVLFSVMVYTAKLASSHISGSEVSFFRLFMGFITVLVLMWLGKVPVRTADTRLLISRGIIGGTGVLLFFLSLEKGSIVNCQVLQNTYPIFAVIIATIAIKEKLSLRVGVSLAISFLGIILLTQPSISSFNAADLLALGSGFLGGFAVTAIRQLRKVNESAWRIFFYYCLFGMVASLVFAWPHWQWPNGRETVLLVMTGILGLLGQVMMTSAYKYCTAAVGGTLSMTSILFTALLGIILLHEQVTVLEVFGAVMITAGSFLCMIDKRPIEAAGE